MDELAMTNGGEDPSKGGKYYSILTCYIATLV